MKKLIKTGKWYYEIQILMFVIMWKHDLSHKPAGEHNALLSWGRLYIWYDSAWRFHGLPGEIRFFFYELTLNSQHLERRLDRWQVIGNNARRMFREWAIEKPLLYSILSLRNYISLHRAGFRITRATSNDMSTALYRFWWERKLIDDMCDIDRVDDHWGTMFKGKSRRLKNNK